MTATLTAPDLLTTLTPRRDRALEQPPALGLTVDDLEELLLAVGDREDAAGADARARLGRGRRALELELARILAR